MHSKSDKRSRDGEVDRRRKKVVGNENFRTSAAENDGHSPMTATKMQRVLTEETFAMDSSVQKTNLSVNRSPSPTRMSKTNAELH